MKDLTLFLALAIPINKWGVAGSGNPHLKLLLLVIPYSGKLSKRLHTVFSIGIIYINKYPPFCTLRGLQQGKAQTKIVGIGHSILREPHWQTGYIPIIFCFGIIPINIPFSHHLGVAGRGNPPFKIASIGNSIHKEPQWKIWQCLSIGVIPINKYPLFAPFEGC